MHLIILLGPHAVGKMTVGQELAADFEVRIDNTHLTPPEAARRIAEAFGLNTLDRLGDRLVP